MAQSGNRLAQECVSLRLAKFVGAVADKKELLCRLVTVHTFERPGGYGVPLKSGEDALYFDADGNFIAANYGLLDIPVRESEIRQDQIIDAKYPIHVLIVKAEYAPDETDTQPTNYKLILDTNGPLPNRDR